MNKLLPLLLILAMSSLIISCQSQKENLSPAIVKELDASEQAMFAATSNGDSAAFRKICGTDYFTINENGKSATLEEAIPYVPRFKGSSVELSDQHQRVYGDFALRTGHAKFMFGGQQVAEALYSTGWIYRDNRWQFVHWQGTMTGMMLEPLQGKVMMEPPAVGN